MQFEIPQPVSIPVAQSDRPFPINRIFCVGRNYAAHAAEMGTEVDREAPWYFTKSPASACLSGSDIPYPLGTANCHHEMEFVIAIGAPAFRIEPEKANGAIFGYCCGLDMTRRDRQQDGKDKRRPWDLGKDFENSGVFSRITKRDVFGLVKDQEIWLSVNGELRQQGKLSDMVWRAEEIVAHLSRYYHLAPGDLIMTGTPSGVGPVEPGDRILGGVAGLDDVALNIGPPE